MNALTLGYHVCISGKALLPIVKLSHIIRDIIKVRGFLDYKLSPKCKPGSRNLVTLVMYNQSFK